jgi:NADH:ubiquinone oxidoreductase subunit 5 (subunit L)/multisubunit Na+/H+ antiporter MnhA subunit
VHDHGHHGNPVEHAHESPPIMTWPLMILAFFSIFVGWTWQLGLPIDVPVLERMLESAEPLPAMDVAGSKWMAMGASILIAASGIAAAVGYYSRWRIFNPEAARRRLAPLHSFFAHKWYFDELYDAIIVRPTLAFARWIRGFDLAAIDGVVNGAARVTRRLSDVGGLIDKYVVDGAVHAVALVLAGLGLLGRSLQTGRVRTYLALLALMVVGLFVGMYAWVR